MQQSGARGGNRPTLAAVAKLAGVSLKTTSRVFNDEPHVSDATRRRVRDAADALGFRVNAVAAELARGGASRLVGFVTGDVANPFYSAIAGGVERELRARGFQLVVASSDEDPEREEQLIGSLLDRRAAALLVVSTTTDHAALGREIRSGTPVVFVDRPPSGVEADTVVLDNRGGAARATRHLVAGGHRRIALVGDLPHLWTFQERLAGFYEAMSASGVAEPDRYVRHGAHTADDAEAEIERLLALPEPPTAVLAENNKITLGALRVLHRRRVGTALVGFDDFDLADVLGVSVVRYEAREIGRTAASLALGRMDEPTSPPRRVVLPTVLVERGSGERAPAGCPAILEV